MGRFTNVQLIIATVLFSITFVQCTKHQPCDGRQTSDVYRIGERYCLGEHEYIEIDSIEDSRCPTDTDCIWEGKINMYIYLFAHNTLHDAVLSVPNTGKSATIPDIFGYDFTVDSITPYPKETELIPQNSYKIYMKIEER
jgi:hypothetical protein